MIHPEKSSEEAIVIPFPAQNMPLEAEVVSDEELSDRVYKLYHEHPSWGNVMAILLANTQISPGEVSQYIDQLAQSSPEDFQQLCLDLTEQYGNPRRNRRKNEE
jgi:hypothetical protein